MSGPDRAAVEAALANHIDPHLGTGLVAARCIREIDTTEGVVRIDVMLGYPAAGYQARLRAELEALVGALPGVRAVEITVSSRIAAHAVQPGVEPLPEIKNIIAVASGKGGVGKSTISANLALALRAEGASVGMLDADIYGPSQPRMLGVVGRPESPDGKSIEPMVGFGVQSMSIGYLIDEETPMIWRGPMVTQALEQLLQDTNWRALDYLIVDLPPGTGDVQLTLAQRVPVSGAVIVTTPQDIALLDARKAFKMFEKVEVAVLGVVENMSIHVCSQCGHEEHVFGSGGAERMARDYDVKLLGSLPLDIHVREGADGGRPTVVSDPDGPMTERFHELARCVAGRLSMRPRNMAQGFPKIVVEGR
jgi:ATP-binding protein involved in chromosome partitioning